MTTIYLIIHLLSICLRSQSVDQQYDWISLYPKEGEFLEYKFPFDSKALKIESSPAFFYLVNKPSAIFQTDGEFIEFKSLSSKNTHICWFTLGK